MSAVELFTYADVDQLRLILRDGSPWFVAADALALLDVNRSSLTALDDDEKGVHTLDTLGGEQSVTIISESGFYSLVLRSRKPEAKAIKRWLTHDVLPAIRKTGSYGKPTIDGNSITRMELIEIARNAETERLALEAENKELAPKAEAFDAFLDATGKYSVGAVAKMLGTSQNKLFRELRNCGVLIAKGAMRNTPYQQYMHHFEVVPHEFERANGDIGCSYTTYVQPSGIDFIRRKLGLPTIDPLPGDPKAVAS